MKSKKPLYLRASIFIFCIIIANLSRAQTISLTDFSAFQKPGPTWRQASNVNADLTKSNTLASAPGAGILVNTPDKKNKGTDLISIIQHGDADVELDFMMAKGSNSGVYLQGRYEVQLFDSWGKLQPSHSDVGGVYQRWDDGKPEGKKGYEGHAPRQNAGRAPGLWQHLKISFQAPKFSSGVKTENARMLRVELNGVPVQENVELTGTTRSSMASDEVALGPLLLQGDHGAVAFRNIRITNFNKPRPELKGLKYTVYKGKYLSEPDYAKLPPEAAGSSGILSSNISSLDNEFLIRYTGNLNVKEPGEYKFDLSASGGSSSLKLNNKVAVHTEKIGSGTVNLTTGDTPFELVYSKHNAYNKTGLGLTVSGPGMREFILSDANVASPQAVDPILIHAPVNTTLRSFVDFAPGVRITHAVNVGSPQQVHYTYDMDNGTIVQFWRGGFLDATPMWHSRGDGSSRPAGALQRLEKIVPAINNLNSPDLAWPTDTSGTGFKLKGYALDAAKCPTFRYSVFNTMVSDASRVMDGGQGLSREISIVGGAEKLYHKLADAKNIEIISDNLYLLNDKSYFIRIDNADGEKPIIRNSTIGKELLLPIKSKIAYSILF
jgi:hypothetical protein